MKRINKWYVAPLISMTLLTAVWAEWQMFHLPADNSDAYHNRIRVVADQLPYRIDGWIGEDVKAPPSAMALLKPNLILGRRFKNPDTGEEATLVIVQCRDARDMGGHYPPRCYPGHGWTQQEAKRIDVEATSGPIPAMQYRFTMESPDRFAEVVIYNFFVHPDGSMERGNHGVRRSASDPRLKMFGAGQVQVLFKQRIPERRRNEVVQMLVNGASPVIRAIRNKESRNERS